MGRPAGTQALPMPPAGAAALRHSLLRCCAHLLYSPCNFMMWGLQPAAGSGVCRQQSMFSSTWFSSVYTSGQG